MEDCRLPLSTVFLVPTVPVGTHVSDAPRPLGDPLMRNLSRTPATQSVA